MATKGSSKQQADENTETVELASGTKVTRGTGEKPGPDVSNADIDLASVSADSGFSTIHENPDPNPDGLRPAPGRSVIEVLGVPEEGADPSNPMGDGVGGEDSSKPGGGSE